MDPSAQHVPAVTLVVACYNHERFVEKALKAAFGQDHPNVQVIITDDASRDGSQSRIRQLLAEHDWQADLIFHQQNRGICATFNEALGRVETPYVAFISADDWQDTQRVSVHVSVLEANPGASLVYGPIAAVDEDGRCIGLTMDEHFGSPWPGGVHEDLFERLLVEGNWIPAPSVMSRTEMLRAVGGYDESLAFEDYDMWLRLARVSDFAFSPEPLVSYRIVPGSLAHEIGFGVQGRVPLTWVRMFSKHLGISRRLDDWLLPRIYVGALAHFKGGGSPGDVAAVLRGVARRRPSIGAAVFAGLATMGVRWHWVEPLHRVVRVPSYAGPGRRPG